MTIDTFIVFRLDQVFSLKLQPTYDLLGSQYGCLGTINYKLDSEEGGHYVTNLFPSSNECLKVHELEAKCSWKKPDFDTETEVAHCYIGMFKP